MKKTELAREYFPDMTERNARRRLMGWVKGCPQLYAQLTQNSRNFDRRHHLTIKEVKLIKYYLGDP